MSKERSDAAKRPLDRRVGDAACRRCGGHMKPSKAIAQTWNGEPEWPGDTIYTMSPGGPGRLIDCLKCEKCGHSVSCAPTEVDTQTSDKEINMRKSAYEAYEVVFTDGRSMKMWALSGEQAKILAQAEAINRGENYDVKECNYVVPVVA